MKYSPADLGEYFVINGFIQRKGKQMLFFKKNEDEKKLKAFISGKLISITDVNDKVFSAKILGNGVAILPNNEEVILSPGEGEITMIADETRHAVGMKLQNGAELLIHVGLETIGLHGEGFKYFVKEGDKVKAGDKLLQFDKQLIENKGLDSVCILVVTNSDNYPDTKYYYDQDVISGDSVILKF